MELEIKISMIRGLKGSNVYKSTEMQWFGNVK